MFHAFPSHDSPNPFPVPLGDLTLLHIQNETGLLGQRFDYVPIAPNKDN